MLSLQFIAKCARNENQAETTQNDETRPCQKNRACSRVDE